MCAVPSTICRCCCVAAIGLSIMGSMRLVASDDDGEPRERVILLVSGRVLTGVATRNAGGWLVEQGSGRVHVPLEEVTLVAKNMVDAYRQQRDSVAEPTPATHVALAQWCISYRMYDEARDELRKCLKLDPDHAAARKLLHRVDVLLEPSATKPAVPAALRTSDGFLVPDVEALGGLSNKTAVEFTLHIQPLLMNKCGNASCHGSVQGTKKSAEIAEGFHLIPVRNGSNSHRIYSERNLAEVLCYIDLNDPSQSPLVAMPLGGHAGTTNVFLGSTGTGQLKTLRTWVKAVSAEKLGQEEELAARPSIVAKGRRPIAVAAGKGAGPREPDDGDYVVREEPEAKPLQKAVTGHLTVESVPSFKTDLDDNADMRPAKATTRPVDEVKTVSTKIAQTKAFPKSPDKSDDAFDPEVFNRRFHSKRP